MISLNLNAFFRLIRFRNLLIVVLTQVTIKFLLINSFLSNSALLHLDFIIYLFTLTAIVAGGYVINDIYDIKTDKINKPRKRIIEKEITKSSAFKLYYTLNLLALISGFYVSYQINKLWFGFIFLFLILSLWRYSKKYKTAFLIGNIQIAFLTSLSILMLAIFDLVPIGITNNNGSRIIFYIILFYTGFSFIITLIREIIKDMEDLEGDKEIGANTLAINYGIEKTKKITVALILIPIAIIFFFQYLQCNELIKNASVREFFWWKNLIPSLYTSSLQILLIMLLIHLKKANTKNDFNYLSTLCKIIMLIGILSIVLFYFLY